MELCGLHNTGISTQLSSSANSKRRETCVQVNNIGKKNLKTGFEENEEARENQD